MERSSAGGVVVVDTASGAVRQVVEARAHEALVGVDVPAPLTLARVLHAAHPELLVTLQVRDGEGALAQAIAASPLLFGAYRVSLVGMPASSPPHAGVRRGPIDAWAALEEAPEPAVVVGREGRILGLNPRAGELLGGSERALLGAWLPGWFAEPERAAGEAHLRDGGSTLVGMADGTVGSVVAWRYPGVDPTLRLVLLRRPDPRELDARVERLALDAIVDHLPSMIFVKEATDLRFVRFNRAAEALLGYTRQDLLGRNDYDFFPKQEADFFTQKDREVLAGGVEVDIPAEPIHTAAGLRWLHTRKVPLLDANGVPHHLLGISEDITDRRHAEEERLRLIAELERSNGELQLFASIASHDLQEPLRKVQQFGARLRGELGENLPPEALDSLTRLEAAITRMRELVYGLLAYSRVTTRGQALVPVALGPILEDVLADLEVRILQSKAAVVVGPLPTVVGDATQLRQLFQNLVGNALKFHRPGAHPVVEVKGQLLPLEGEGPALAEVTVRDEGIGFDPSQAEVVFQPFQRLHGRDRYEGTGMGLAICRRIVERHGGHLSVTTALDEGATFTVRLKV